MLDQPTDLRERYPSLAGPPGRGHVNFADAAALLGVKEDWLRKAAVRRGGPPSAKFGGERRFPVAGLERWLDEQWADGAA